MKAKIDTTEEIVRGTPKLLLEGIIPHIQLTLDSLQFSSVFHLAHSLTLYTFRLQVGLATIFLSSLRIFLVFTKTCITISVQI
jgi:hypothetical protein